MFESDRCGFFVVCALTIAACGGSSDVQRQEPSTGTEVASNPDTGDKDTLDASLPPVEVTSPGKCLTDRLCAAEADCQPGERCNTTLVPPECQKLYCALEGEACDPGHGDDLCEPGLTCEESAAPHCCRRGCDGMACGPDGCGGYCGECVAPLDTCVEGACLCVPNCDGSACGDDGCGGSCGECPDEEKCHDGVCCTSSCIGIGCGDDGCGGWCGDCPDGEDCYQGVCCTSSCEDLECGDDGCGGWCGDCPDGDSCTVEGTCQSTWLDPDTHLVWQRKMLDTQRNWHEAMDYCDNNSGGLPGVGWTLPTLSQLRTLVRGCPQTMPGGACQATSMCPDCWTSEDCVGNCGLGGGPDDGCYRVVALDGWCGTFWSSTKETDAAAMDIGFDGAGIFHNGLLGNGGTLCVR